MTSATVTTRSAASGTAMGSVTTGAAATAITTVPAGATSTGATTTATTTTAPAAAPASHPRRTAVRPSPARPTRPVPPAATLASWGARIAADGMRAHEDLAREVVEVAAALGLCPVLVDVLADPGEPTVARERAFGRLAQALALTA